jgi:hypothetical protein
MADQQAAAKRREEKKSKKRKAEPTSPSTTVLTRQGAKRAKTEEVPTPASQEYTEVTIERPVHPQYGPDDMPLTESVVVRVPTHSSSSSAATEETSTATATATFPTETDPTYELQSPVYEPSSPTHESHEKTVVWAIINSHEQAPVVGVYWSLLTACDELRKMYVRDTGKEWPSDSGSGSLVDYYATKAPFKYTVCSTTFNADLVADLDEKETEAEALSDKSASGK